MNVSFTINGTEHIISPSTVPIETSLNSFIRNHANLSGTKFMCLEGGCGACVVTLKGVHPVTKEKTTWAVNSCLQNIYSCHGLDIITVEGIGSKKNGMHQVQKRLANFNGTQCGYCSPGMVMNMYSLLESKNGKVTMEEVENSFGGNICRCTGYRPILDAFKSLASDADETLLNLCKDIEDLDGTKTCPKTGTPCIGSCSAIGKVDPKHSLKLAFEDDREWHKANSIKDIFDVLGKIGDKPYMLVAGNTAHGVYRRSADLKVFIDISSVEELRGFKVNDNTLEIGGNVTLTEAMEIFTKVANEKKGFEYLKEFVTHIDLIANVPVRNNGTIAGNLMIKNKHPEFPSDMFLMLEAAGAVLNVSDSPGWSFPFFGSSVDLSTKDFIKYDMNKKLLNKITLQSYDPSKFTFRSYKIMPRAQNAHAYVNAAFLLELNNSNNTIASVKVCFGGIEPSFTHAAKTEAALVGKDPFSNQTIQAALNVLKDELKPDWVLPDASPEYRKNLALALFYKFILNIIPESKTNAKYKSGGKILERELSSGTQVFDTYKKNWPLTKNIPKIEADVQCTGEAKYVNDLPSLPNEVYAAFVQAKKVHGKILSINASRALQIPGVVAFYSAKDIPGSNTFMPAKIMLVFAPEEIFCSSDVKFNGQPVGIILAETHELANHAAELVDITYDSSSIEDKKIILTLKEALEDPKRVQPLPHYSKTAESSGVGATHKISGRFDIGSQYHYTMETQTCVVVPIEDGLDVYSATQWMDATQMAIADALKVPNNFVNMNVRRLGGGYGGKISRSVQVACAAAIAAHLLNRPVRFVMTIEANMNVVGKRYACINDYEVEVDDNGKILKLKNDYSEDSGCSPNEPVHYATTEHFNNCYDKQHFTVTAKNVTTDAPSSTWCRAPGSVEGVAMIENIMEHIARKVKKDPVDVRMNNIPGNYEMKKLLPEFVKSVDYVNRKENIEAFNNENRWIKRGIAIVPMKYDLQYFGSSRALVSIYHGDGSVSVTTGGIEMGQGLNTKVAQTVAHILEVPLDKVSVKPSNNLTSANDVVTGGSIGSEVNCFAAKKASEMLLERLKPIKAENPKAEWAQLIDKAYEKNVDLVAHFLYKAPDLKPYEIWGISCCEVEVDLLTGNIKIKRADIMEDVGESLSPGIDVGQVEGSFIMGLGYWLNESLIYNQENGELLTNRTWTYKPPGAKDIPIDFRITFLQKSSNPFGVLRSKATGEPAVAMSIVALNAVRHALDSARTDAGLKVDEDFYHLGAPTTAETIFIAANHQPQQFTKLDKMKVTITINGKPFEVSPSTVPIETSLNSFIRNHANLSGTKFMCLEGGCGACVVTLKGVHPVTKEKTTWAVNSCLQNIYSCHGLDIITVEGIGSKKNGMHQVQKRLANFNGTQCGYCSPGMVMNMYSLLESKNGKVTMEEVENSFGGNICRCTGYRPILDAFKSLASDADETLLNLCKDIEDLDGTKTCPKTGTPCIGSCSAIGKVDPKHSLKLAFEDDREWHKANSIKDIFDVLGKIGDKPYMLVAGNTAHGVYRRSPDLKVFIDISSVEELRGFKVNDNTLEIGGNVTLTEAMEIFTKVANEKKGFEYLKEFVTHIDLIANVPVRNNGTIAGNLMIKNKHPEFPSDMFIIFEGVGAKITVASNIGEMKVGCKEFAKLMISKKVISTITLPKLDSTKFTFRSYKIMPRAQNAHAYVNAAFLLELNNSNNTIASVKVCFGGIEPSFTHAAKTEAALVGKDPFSNQTIQAALNVLKDELKPDWVLPDASPEYRKNLALALFYKFILNIIPESKTNAKYKSGGKILERELSSGTQVFDTYKKNWPLTKNIPKIEADVQCTGEAKYVNDLPSLPNEVYAAFVQAKKVHGKILSINASRALQIPGVVAFYSAKDIPGSNTFMPPKMMFVFAPEEIFCASDVKFNGQPVGIILAETLQLANRAAEFVDIIYDADVGKKIVTSLKDIYQKAPELVQNFAQFSKVSTEAGTDTTHKISGHFEMGSQFHFSMEPQTCVVVPTEDGLDVFPAAQWVDATQMAIADALSVPNNYVNINVRRLGGGFGGKVSRNIQVACAAALGAYLSNRPVRFVMTIEANMDVIGKRYPCMNDYDVEIDNNGKIQKLSTKFIEDGGCSPNDPIYFHTIQFMSNCYDGKYFSIDANAVNSNTPANTWCRAPGTTEGIAMIENIMEHIARKTKKDPVEVRMNNCEGEMVKLLPEFVQSVDYYERKKNIETFNSLNRWIKRGIAVVPLKYHLGYFGHFHSLVSIYHGDGSVSVTVGGIEMGQGLNTKVAQTVAHILGVPLDKVSVKPTSNLISPNAICTGGSSGSEISCYATKKACEMLLERLNPVKTENPNRSWSELIDKAYEKNVNLSATYMYEASELKDYYIYGASCCEVEVDLLTGNLLIKRVDIMEDVGESLSPGIDVGQIEGAFVFGLGYWLTEGIIYNQENGELLTNRTWNYKPPGAKDIPIDFRVTFLRKSSNPFGVLRSKATGEPATNMSIVAVFALRHALDSARNETGLKSDEDFYHLVSPSTVPIETSLNSFIRNHANLSGTKFMCLEGGCGACVVTLKEVHPVTKEKTTWAVNSCLQNIYSCHGLDIITVEGIGSKKNGMHQVQKRLANFNGTQCGYCSPGMVMNMYSLLESKNGKVTMEEVENSFGGNICRCTGYRPILDAFKSLASDADETLLNLCNDIEDLDGTKTCPKTGTPCIGSCSAIGKVDPKHSLKLAFEDDREWHKANSIKDIFDVLGKIGDKPYMLVAGNTAHGVYRRSPDLKVFIDISSVEELRGFKVNDNTLEIGGNVTLTEAMEIFTKVANEKKGFEYLKEFVTHIDLIANVPVRNNGTIAGNLMIKNKHPEFPSDMFIIFEGVGAKITVASNIGEMKVGCKEFAKLMISKKVISTITLPKLDSTKFTFRSYKIMPRAQNAHAYVNAAFLLELNNSNNTIASVKVCFGGIEPSFTHAAKTEAALVGKDPFSNQTIQAALNVLKDELKPDWVLPDASPEYRKNLALALFYKFILNIIPESKTNAKYKSGGKILERELSSGTQVFDTYKKNWPLTKNIPKIEADVQCTGEAKYVNDLPSLPNEVYAAFVQAKKVHGKILSINASRALQIPGVVAFYSAKDIPGNNTFMPSNYMFVEEHEEIFCSSDIKFYGQPVGIILAETFELSNQAAELVDVFILELNKDDVNKVATSLDNLQTFPPSKLQIASEFCKKASKIGEKCKHKLKGKFKLESQFHYSMEPQTCVVVPVEDGLDVYSSTQWIDMTQIAIAEALKIPESSINMQVRRLGGGFGGKISRAALIACAAAIAAHHLNRPVRLVLSIEANMNVIGKRYACINDYEVEVDDNGKIQKLLNDYTENYGCSFNEPAYLTTKFLTNCYESEMFEVIARRAKSDIASNTWCRGPGTVEGIAMVENIMEHIARKTKLDPLEVRLINIPNDCEMKKHLKEFAESVDYASRKEEFNQFNQENRWIKRGIAIVPMKFHIEYFGSLHAIVSIYHRDGSVAVTVGGIEMGQGLNTKVAQTVAHILGVPLDQVSVKPSNNLTSANDVVTGGSIGSEISCHAVKKACEIILDRLHPIKINNPNLEWTELIEKSFDSFIDLTAVYMYKPKDLEEYFIYGASCCEVEVDLLTGSTQVKRVDIMEDVGESLSPGIDVGQIEGAFIMGLGYWLTEKLIYDSNTGELLTNRTWNYKPPGAKDIPIDFRVTFLRKSSNPFGVLRSKATGEPALCMSIVVIFALRHALESARSDAEFMNADNEYFNLDLPASPEILKLSRLEEKMSKTFKVVVLLVIFLGFNSYDVLCHELLRDFLNFQVENPHIALSKDCGDHLEMLRNGIKENEVWALKVQDASGKPTSGFTWGNNFWLGAERNCYLLNQPPKISLIKSKNRKMDDNMTEIGSEIPVEYRMFYASHTSKIQFDADLFNKSVLHIGLCFPEACDETEVHVMAKKIFHEKFQDFHLYGEVNYLGTKTLTIRKEFLNETFVLLLLVIIVTFVVLAIIGTTYVNNLKSHRKDMKEISALPTFNNDQKNLKNKLKASLAEKFWRCFSLKDNCGFIMSTKINRKSIAPIHGVRAIGALWIMAGHVYYYAFGPTDNIQLIFSYANALVLQPLFAAAISVDSFYVMSGFLLSYAFYEKQKKRPSKQLTIDVIRGIVYRYIRITPCFMIIMLLAVTISIFLNDTSQYLMIENIEENCKNYWWRNVLCIQNFYPLSEMCMSWS
ncbi:CLUMA_CG021290, isoform A [Clunio marinus]|uniref:Indole-3-acetaldehyde oxidase n=1 Tax=Clunio marinus TaxID=568069 RepID=A0A1J1J970_9DIPT|nr:CLUMA_CG021290, isoform A [Clunio marinus]